MWKMLLSPAGASCRPVWNPCARSGGWFHRPACAELRLASLRWTCARLCRSILQSVSEIKLCPLHSQSHGLFVDRRTLLHRNKKNWFDWYKLLCVYILIYYTSHKNTFVEFSMRGIQIYYTFHSDWSVTAFIFIINDPFLHNWSCAPSLYKTI